MDELQKASDRFDLPSANSSNEGVLAQSSSTMMEEMQTAKSSSPLLDSGEGFQSSPFPVTEDRPFDDPNASAISPSEPAWLAEFDPEFIESLRGCVNFVD